MIPSLMLSLILIGQPGTEAPLIMRRTLLFLLIAAPAFAQPAAKQITDAEIASMIVQASRDAYYRTGRPCACPDDVARNGSRCGGRSAYSRPGGASPYCYPSDVPKAEIDRYRTNLR
jgi:hypothetical protein